LAIELIAAQSEGLAPAALLAQLRDRRFDLLQGGASDPPPDQRALINALHRSYRALPAEEQALFRAIGVFAGGCDLAAASQLGFDLPVVQALVHKSLVRMTAAGSERRIVQLETLREYARWQLDAAGETLAVEAQRLAYVVALAERAEPHLHSAAQTEWLHRLEANLPNFHGALDFALASGQLDAGVRLVAALSHFWVTRNHLAETLRRLHLLCTAATEQGLDDHLWARLLNCQATIAFYLGNFELARESYATALAHAERAGNRRDMAYALDGLGAEAANRDDLPAARAFSKRSLTHSLAIGDRWLAGITLMNLGEVARMEHAFAAAAQRYAESLAHLQAAGDPFFIAVAQINLAQLRLHAGDLAGAEAFLRRSLDAGLQAESVQVVAPALEKLAQVFLARDPAAAARLMGVATGLRYSTTISVQPVDRHDHAQLVQALQGMVDTPAYRAFFTVGASKDWPAIRVVVGL
jgi:tetratricopeptide (TPR) repeat protein